jgi:hypothetical protein
MTISLLHAFTNPKADGGDATIVRPSNWNAEHTLTQATDRMLGRVTASTGVTEELTSTQVRTFIGYGNPPSTDGLPLGSTSFYWSDLFLASGGVINFNNDITLTHATDTLSGGGGQLLWTFGNTSTPPIRAVNNSDNANVNTAQFDGDRATVANGDSAYIQMRLSDSAGNQDAFARLTWYADDVTSGSEDGTLKIGVITAGTMADEIFINGSAIMPAANDELALGTAALQFSDLFLASGGIINWNNGDITWTHSSGGVTQDGGYFQVKNADLASTHAIYVVNNVNTATASVAVFEGDRSAPTNNDQAHIDLRLSDSAGNQDVFARIKWLATDVTSTSEDGWMYFGVTTAGTYADELILSGTALFPQTTGGLALGTSSLGFSDIHLSTGADINWNSGESRIIQSTPNYMYFDGACFEYNYNDATTFGAIVYMQASEDVAYQNILSIGHDRATPTANDSASISLRLADSTGTATSFGRIQWQGTTITAGSEECTMYLRTSQAGIMRDALTLSKNNVAATTNAGANVVAIGLTNYLMQTTDYTLSSVGTEQKLFNQTTNGTLTLPLGVYEFECFLYLTTMSATSGNYAFDPIGAGTAVTDRWGQYAIGIDNTTPLSAGAWSGSASVTQQTVASAVTAGTGTGAVVTHKGMFRITTGGTIIPSITLVTANAAVVKAGSYFKITKFGDSNATVGAWT